MKKIRVSKEFHFEMAHALWNYDGPCKNIHGHSYKLIITLMGKPIMDHNNPKNGMLIDFTDMKNTVNRLIINKLDHSFVVNKYADIARFSEAKQMFDKIIVTDYQPTCENILLDIVEQLKTAFAQHIQLFSIRLYETATSYAEWYYTDNSI